MPARRGVPQPTPRAVGAARVRRRSGLRGGLPPRTARRSGAAGAVLSCFLQWRPQLEVLLRFHQLFDNAAGVATVPVPRRALGEFTLLAEFGRGAVGRVFRQPAVAGQPPGRASNSRRATAGSTTRAGPLAAHQHRPGPLVQDDRPQRPRPVHALPRRADAGVRAGEVRRRSPAARTGRLLLLSRCRPAGRPRHGAPVAGAARHFLARAGYVEAVCVPSASAGRFAAIRP